jgi:hypothetical protein
MLRSYAVQQQSKSLVQAALPPAFRALNSSIERLNCFYVDRNYHDCSNALSLQSVLRIQNLYYTSFSCVNAFDILEQFSHYSHCCIDSLLDSSDTSRELYSRPLSPSSWLSSPWLNTVIPIYAYPYSTQ